MPAPVSKFKIYGKESENRLVTGGGKIFLIPPPITYQAAGDIQARLTEMSGWVWEDLDRRTMNEGMEQWCLVSADGVKYTMKNKTQQFDLNDRNPIIKKTGVYEEAKLSFDAMDIVMSAAHMVDLMGQNAFKFQQKPAGSEGAEKGTGFIINDPSILERDIFIAYVLLGHPEFEGRCTVNYWYGNIVADIDSEMSINNPLKMNINFNLKGFPNMKQPNGLPVYQVTETPMGEAEADLAI